MRAPLAWMLLLGCSPGLAQEATARGLRERHAAQTAGTGEWFASGCELVEAELAFDVAAAVATAEQLRTATHAVAPGDRAIVADALHRLAVALREGPGRATAAPAPAGESASGHPVGLGEDASAELQARFHLSRARHAWLADTPTEAVASLFAGLDAARTAAVPTLHLRAAWALHLVTEREASAYDAELLDEIAGPSASPAGEAFAAWRALNLYWRTSAEHRREERLSQLDAIERQAKALGDLRTLVHVDWDRAVHEMAAENAAAAMAVLDETMVRAARLGDRRMHAVTLELAAEFALEREQPDVALLLLDRASALVADRGFPDRESQQAHLRMRLASLRHDAAAMAKETQLLEGLRKEEAARYRGYPTLREQLLSKERLRREHADRLAHERLAAADTLRAMRTWAMAGAIVALTLLVAMAWRSRRRLLIAHQALRREMERAEAEGLARRELEQRLRQMERSESLGIIAGGIAHDFNNLMVGVLGNAEVLKADEADPERERMLAAIVAAGERGARLCGQLQLYAGGQPMRREAVDVPTLLRELVPVLQAAAGPRLRVTVATNGEPLVFEGNPTELEQAVLNLVTNARDANARDVQLRLGRETMAAGSWRAQLVRGTTTAGTFAVLEVHDDGDGMSADLVERIFDPFFTTRFPGRGLGLAVVFGAVRRHQGAITVDSLPGHGTTFRLFLPVQPGSAAPTAEPTVARSRQRVVRPMTVLVVDDEVHVRELIRSALGRRGHHVLCLADGQTIDHGLEQMAKGSRGVALVDLTMPGMDGRDVVRAIRARRHDLPIVLMSGHAVSHLVDTMRELAVDGHVAKPFTPADLEVALDDALQRRVGQANAGS